MPEASHDDATAVGGAEVDDGTVAALDGADAAFDDQAPPTDSGASGGSVSRVVRLAGIVSALIWIALAVGWAEGPFALTDDDAYHYLEVARRLADGQGPTFDGLDETNGYHPLWLLLCSVPYLVGVTGMAALRSVLVVQAVMWGATWWVIGGIVGRSVGGWPMLTGTRREGRTRLLVATVGGTALLVAANPASARIGISGSESGLVLLVGALVLARVTTGGGRILEGRSPAWRWGLGLLLAVAVSFRTDHVLLVGTVGLAIWFEPRGGRSLTHQARLAAPVLGVPAVVTALYLVVNQVVFGAPLPISGEIERLSLTPALAVVALVVGSVVVALVRAGARFPSRPPRPNRRIRSRRARGFAAATAWYGTFHLGLIVYATLFQAQQQLWYFLPPLVWVTVLLLLLAADGFESALAEATEDQTDAVAVFPLCCILVPFVIGLALQWQNLTDPEIRSIQVADKRAAEWINRELPPDAVLASWDAGALGYFADRPVVNLDGAGSSREWLQAAERGPLAARVFLDAHGVTHIVNHGSIVDGHDPDIVDFIGRVYGPERAGAVELVETFPFTHSEAEVGPDGRKTGTRALSVKVYRIPPPAG